MMPCQCLYQATCPQLLGVHQGQDWLGGHLQEPITGTCAEILTMAGTWEIPAYGVVQHLVSVLHVTVEKFVK